jgi:phosphomannomutase
MKRLIVFDLDGTLAESKSSLDAEMSVLLHALLDVAKVAVISGGAWPQFETQLLAHLPREERMKDLFLLPTCGTKFLVHERDWTELYSEDLTSDDKRRILAALSKAREAAGPRVNKVWGDVIEDRGSQITFSALGQRAPLDAKRSWDPDFAKRTRMKVVLDTLIPEFSVRMGGATSIDVTKLGIDKAYGVGKLREVLGISFDEMLFVGDALFVGGNDRPVKDAGVACIQVRDPDETKRVVETLIACLGAGS